MGHLRLATELYFIFYYFLKEMPSILNYVLVCWFQDLFPKGILSVFVYLPYGLMAYLKILVAASHK